jgi:hypothetical protein
MAGQGMRHRLLPPPKSGAICQRIQLLIGKLEPVRWELSHATHDDFGVESQMRTAPAIELRRWNFGDRPLKTVCGDSANLTRGRFIAYLGIAIVWHGDVV